MNSCGCETILCGYPHVIFLNTVGASLVWGQEDTSNIIVRPRKVPFVSRIGHYSIDGRRTLGFGVLERVLGPSIGYKQYQYTR